MLWDLCLSEGTAQFFRNAIREKDRLLGFQTLERNRHFPSEEELCHLLEASDLSFVTPVKMIDYVSDTSRRLEQEFGGDETLYQQWLKFLRKTAAADVDENTLTKEMKWNDRGDRIVFHVKKAIICAKRKKTDANVYRHLPDVWLPEELLEDAAVFPAIAGQMLTNAWDSRILNGKKALVRPAVLTRSYGPKPELCREGLDYLCDYSSSSRMRRVKSALISATLRACIVPLHKRTGTRTGDVGGCHRCT